MRNPIDRLTEDMPRGYRVLIDWLATVAFALAIVLFVKTEVANPYRIPSSSMEPTLHCARPATGCESGYSDRVLANRFIYRFRDPHRGEIVVFRAPPEAARLCQGGGVYVKRLIGLPGDVVSEAHGTVVVNGHRLDEPYVQPADRDTSTRSFGRIPPGRYFFMGDNRASSCDSRTWGTVPRAALIGPVFVTYWPPQRIGTP
ncbi:MAG TPA: signal peptidase I [Gaiellaceae bacterium]|nr:signal peptidase I [Gaiellaceae bacterium]